MATPSVDRDAAQIRLAELLSATALGDKKAFAELYRLTKAKLLGA
jgi:hypothetical protein